MKKEVKTSIDGLHIGMFVSRLDRPWIQTKFPMEGMTIESKKDIDNLRNYCNYVYVDVERGPSPEPRYWVLKEVNGSNSAIRSNSLNKTSGQQTSPSNEYTKIRKKTYHHTSSFKAESKVAIDASDKVQNGYYRFLDDLKRGRELDINTVKEGISVMVESIIRNPSAMMWVTQVKKLDEFSYSRALGTSVWCATFGRHLGMEKGDIEQIALGGLLLDIGKTRLPLRLLKKSGGLNETELKLLRSHVQLGVKLLAKISDTSKSSKLPIPVFQMIATHHERADARGYPQGLLNSQIPIFGRIAGIVDTYDAITSRRLYNADMPPKLPHEAIAELYELRDTAFQSELVEQFIQTVGLYPTGSLVELSTGEVGVVVATNGLRRLRPTVMLLLDEDKKPLSDFRHLDLSLPEAKATVQRGLQAGAYGIDMKELFL